MSKEPKNHYGDNVSWFCYEGSLALHDFYDKDNEGYVLADFDIECDNGSVNIDTIALLESASVVIDKKSNETNQLRKELEDSKAQNLVHAWDVEKLLVVMQSFCIELAQGNQKAANSWIINTLFGPGLIPENTAISAQEHFDNALKDRIETLDEAKAKLKQQSEK